MKKKVQKKEELTKKNLAHMLDNFGVGITSKIDKLSSGIKGLDFRISKLESYMKEGFISLDNKIEHVDARLSNQIEGLGRRMDDFADNKVSRITYKELEHRVIVLESRILPKSKK